MCCPCGFLCCGDDTFGRCGCNNCLDPRCHETKPDEGPVVRPANDDLEEETLAARPLAAARFRCVEVRP